MRWLSIALLAILIFTAGPAKSADAADFAFSFGFHNELAPYGAWVSYSNYGNVWRPYAYSGWQPYVDGYWAYSDAGPYWYGNEAYAPITYHYGYWIFTARYGWVWIPGYDWHAGRVNWSYGGGYIGWRPQFPGGYSYPGSDYNFWVVIDADRFGYNNYRPYALRSTAVRDLFDRRVFTTTRVNTIRRADLERVVRRPLREVSIRDRDVRIGDRRARLRVTNDEEVRIRKNVERVKQNKGNDRVSTASKQIEKRDVDNRSKNARKDKDVKNNSSNNKKSDSLRKTSSSSRKVEAKSNSSQKSFATSKKIEKEKPSRSKSTKSNVYSKKSDRDSSTKSKSAKSNMYSRKSDRDSGSVKKVSNTSKKSSGSVKKASSYSRKPAKVEKASRSDSRGKSTVKSTSYRGKKSDVSSSKKSTGSTKKATVKKERDRKPSKRH